MSLGRLVPASAIVIAFGFLVSPASAQTSGVPPIEIGAQATVLRLSEFDITDTGVGVVAAWHAAPRLAIDGALSWFPGGDAGSRRINEQDRVLGLAGVRSGARVGRVEYFGRIRAGFLRFAPVDQAVCVAITTVPLPLECHIATGYTAFATDIGGGISLNAGNRLAIRIDAGDLIVRYGIEAHRSNGTRADGFNSHNLQVSSGVVWRF